jgi:hypothetical protein
VHLSMWSADASEGGQLIFRTASHYKVREGQEFQVGGAN